MSLGFSGVPIKNEQSEDLYQMEIFKDGAPLNIILEGIEIRYQFSIGNCFLIVTSYDYWDGEQTWFNLLSKDMKIIDVISPLDQNGFVEVVERYPNGLDFTIYERDHVWNISVVEKSFWSYSLSSIFQRPLKLWLSKRFLKLRRKKHSRRMQVKE